MIVEYENGTGVMFRFWSTDGKRLALWRVWYDGRFEYHVTHKGKTIVEDFYADSALNRADAHISALIALGTYCKEVG